MKLTLLKSCGLALAVCGVGLVGAQVRGVSYTLAPRAAYLLPGDNSGLDRTFAYGGDLGLSFGQFIELRGTYLQSINGKTDLSRIGIDALNANLPAARDVEVRRIGGDVKFNIGNGGFLPYLTVGTGVQRLRLDGGDENENIYGNAGLGFVLSAADRYTFFAEGRYTQYRNNALSALLTAGELRERNLVLTPGASRRVGNYSVEAGLAFYLGGRRPGDRTELDEAYADQFGDGFRNVSLEIEPSLSQINFDNALPYRDTYLGGASLGLNFGPLVGIRGYYYQAMLDDKINLDFEDLAMYGLDMRFNLNNVSTGLVPFLIVGGGYLDADDTYVGRDEQLGVRSQGFATGGGGIVLGLGRNLRVRGSVKALLMSGTEIENLSSTDQITTSTQYTVGLDLALGRKAADGDAIAERKREEALEEQRKRNAVQAKDLKLGYEQRLVETEERLNAAYAAQDSAQIAALTKVQRETAETIGELEEREARTARRTERLQDSLGRLRDRNDRNDRRYADDRRYDEERRYDDDRRYAADRRYDDDRRYTYSDERRYTDERRADRGTNNDREPSKGTIRMSVAELEGLIEEIFESSTPLGMEGIQYPLAPNPTIQQPGATYVMPMDRMGSVQADSAFAKTQRENAALRREIEQMRKDMNAARGGTPEAKSKLPAPSANAPTNRVEPQSAGERSNSSTDSTSTQQSSEDKPSAEDPNFLSKAKSKISKVFTDSPEESGRERRKRERAERRALKDAQEAAEDAAKSPN